LYRFRREVTAVKTISDKSLKKSNRDIGRQVR
jgi:hypothetical protein